MKDIDKDVREIIHLCSLGIYTQTEIAKTYNVSNSCVCDIMNRKTWKHIWKD